MSTPPIKRIWVVLFWIEPADKAVGRCIPLNSLTKSFDYYADAKDCADRLATDWIGDPHSPDYEGNDGGIMPCCS